MKKALALLLSVIMLLTLAACDKTADIPQSMSGNPTTALKTAEPSASETPTIIPPQENTSAPTSTPSVHMTESSPSETPLSSSTAPSTPPPSSTPEPSPSELPVSSSPAFEMTPTPISPSPSPEETPSPASTPEPNVTSLRLTVGNSVFSVKLYDNDAAKALAAMLPLTLNMSELNGNEKYYYLPDKLPTDSERVGNINAGDLMLYGSDCLVLFYEGFSTSYSYTRLGYVEDVSGLAAALGSGSVEIIFSK